MLLSHINAVERILVAQGAAAQNAGHPNLRGWPREWFIRDFLTNHLPSSLEIGHGEIIDQESVPEPPQGEYRPEVDIVIYRRDLPKISYSRDNTAFLSEGVLATIESKSVLTKEELSKACNASSVHKNLKRNIPLHALGNSPPAEIVSYVIAYDGPVNVPTVANWLPEIRDELNIPVSNMVEMVVILGKGVVWQKDKVPVIPKSQIPEGSHWVYFEQSEKNLFLFFTHMMSLSAYLSAPPDTLGYGFKFSFEAYGTA
jgi:hypothetical protein